MKVNRYMKDLYRKIQASKAQKNLDEQLKSYFRNGRRPWSEGYEVFKWNSIQEAISDESTLEKFRQGYSLPPGYGQFLDERIVEYPWLLSRLEETGGITLDAGSTLNYQMILEHKSLSNKNLFITTLSPEDNCFWKQGISYIFADIRDLPLKENSFDIVVSISTLEHIGMDNTLVYTSDLQYKENLKNDYVKAVKELNRVLKPGGKCFITVPFGQYQYDVFQQQFNSEMVDKIINTFQPVKLVERYYQYCDNGWNISTKNDCVSCNYFNIHKTKYFNPESKLDYDEDFAAAARAIVTLEMLK